jgi:hypothetical protein
MKTRFVSTMALLLISSGLAMAAEPPQGGGLRTVCKADVEKLCSGIQPGGGRIAGCLKQNEGQVSAPCKDALAKARAKHTPAAPQG